MVMLWESKPAVTKIGKESSIIPFSDKLEIPRFVSVLRCKRREVQKFAPGALALLALLYHCTVWFKRF